jgi:eukaryotic-like serine/threonine-protein kinase
MPLFTRDRLGPYEILASLGAGGMSEVYKARDSCLDRIFAIKVWKTEFSERFEREARAIATLIIPTFANSTTSGKITWSWSTSKALR